MNLTLIREMLAAIREKPASLRPFLASRSQGERTEIKDLEKRLRKARMFDYKAAAFSSYLRLTTAGESLLELLRDEGAFQNVKHQLEAESHSIDLIELRGRLAASRSSSPQAAWPAAGISAATSEPVTRASVPQKIFLVHGHDVAAREQVTIFLERMGLDVISLDQQYNAGKTVIEKFEDNADVHFAVVLLTGDDIGGKGPDELRPRPRQNVIFELGFFMGRLKRDRVCAIRSGEVELPSDIGGMVWLSLEGRWKKDLAIELEKAGYPVQWRKLVE